MCKIGTSTAYKMVMDTEECFYSVPNLFLKLVNWQFQIVNSCCMILAHITNITRLELLETPLFSG